VSEKLIAIQGYKLPSKIDLIIDGAKSAKFIITDIKDEGLIVHALQ